MQRVANVITVSSLQEGQKLMFEGQPPPANTVCYAPDGALFIR